MGRPAFETASSDTSCFFMHIGRSLRDLSGDAFAYGKDTFGLHLRIASELSSRPSLKPIHETPGTFPSPDPCRNSYIVVSSANSY